MAATGIHGRGLFRRAGTGVVRWESEVNTYIVPLVVRQHPAGGEYRTALVEPGVSWVGQPIGNDRYLIRTPHEMEDLPPGRERGERNKLNTQQMRETARENGLNPDDIEHRWFVGS